VGRSASSFDCVRTIGSWPSGAICGGLTKASKPIAIEFQLIEADVELSINFPGTSMAEANRLAAELQNEIQMMGNAVEVRRVKDRADTMDFGATLLVILGAPAVVELAKGPAIELAKGIAAWMKRTGTSISVKCGDKDVVVKHVDSADLPGVIAAICGGAPAQH
jgi:hypothetical protein